MHIPPFLVEHSKRTPHHWLHLQVAVPQPIGTNVSLKSLRGIN